MGLGTSLWGCVREFGVSASALPLALHCLQGVCRCVMLYQLWAYTQSCHADSNLSILALRHPEHPHVLASWQSRSSRRIPYSAALNRTLLRFLVLYFKTLTLKPIKSDTPNPIKAYKPHCKSLKILTIGALIVRIGFWGPLCYKYKKEPPQSTI